MKPNDVLLRLRQIGLVPVVVFDKIEYAIPAAKALMAGGIDTMEITLRTEHGLSAIKKITQEMPEMLVGAGTVLTLEQAKASVEAGAKYIVSPGFDEEVVAWCVENEIAVCPGCVTPTEIQKALKLGLTTVKFFPANVYGGIKACKSLSGPFGGLKFIPTGGVDLSNIADYASEKCVWAIGGGWLLNTQFLKDGNYDKITEVAKKSVQALLDYQIGHVGINNENKNESLSISEKLASVFNMPVKEGNSSNFVGAGFEFNNQKGFGEKGHIAVNTNNLDAAIYHLKKNGVKFIEESRTKDIIYMQEEFSGFAIHLRQK